MKITVIQPKTIEIIVNHAFSGSKKRTIAKYIPLCFKLFSIQGL